MKSNSPSQISISNENPRRLVLKHLSDSQNKVYSFLKNQHIEHDQYSNKKTSISTLEERLDIENCEKIVNDLVDKGLAVRDGNKVMWLPKMSTALKDTLDNIKYKNSIKDENRAK
ncbi:MAG: hypothetical protein ABEI06_02510, partial [Halobacteriaceae archaeon]